MDKYGRLFLTGILSVSLLTSIAYSADIKVVVVPLAGSVKCCEPGENHICYSASPSTINVGECVTGQIICNGEGKWGSCQGEINPEDEIM